MAIYGRICQYICMPKEAHSTKTPTQTSMNVSLPVTLKRYVEKRVKADGYSTPSEYMRELIRTDQRTSEQKNQLEALLREGLAGSRTEATSKFWEDFRKDAHARVTHNKSAGKKRTA